MLVKPFDESNMEAKATQDTCTHLQTLRWKISFTNLSDLTFESTRNFIKTIRQEEVL